MNQSRLKTDQCLDKEIGQLYKENAQLVQKCEILIKNSAIHRLSSTDKYHWIKEHAGEFSVKAMCQLFNVARSAYYDWLKREPIVFEKEDAILIEIIKALFKDGNNDSIRHLKKLLMEQGWCVSRRRISRLVNLANST